MTTAEILENITDEGKFERLVTSILKKQNHEYEHIILSGQNSQGKTVKAPYDGICFVPGSNPTKIIMVEHTTTLYKDLEKKWLFDRTEHPRNKKTPDGDIIKSIKQADILRDKFSTAEFLLILSTNQKFYFGAKKKDPLYIAAQKKCLDFGIDCDIWEQSRISEYLDNDPYGQWLRKKYLDIEAELLSEELLKSICYENLGRYNSESYINNDFHQTRELDSFVNNEINNSSHVFYLLLGESGYGKSTILFKLLKSYLDSGRYGLWIPASYFEELESLDFIIEKTLKKVNPNIEIGYNEQLWDIIKKNGKFLIVADDVNRVDDPEKVIRKIISLVSQYDPKNNDGKVISSPFVILCPIWPKICSSISTEIKNKSHINIIEIDKYTLDEAESIIIDGYNKAGYQITEIESNQLAIKLGCDPFLINSYLQSLKNIDSSRIAKNADDIIDQFIKLKIDEFSKKSPNSYLSQEYEQMLEQISYNMLEKKKFLPSFTEIEDWLHGNSKYLQIFRELVIDKSLCYLDDQGKLIFRHDRIRLHLLTHSISYGIGESPNRKDILSEPYYAEIIGQSLLLKEQDIELLKEIQEFNVLALFEAFKQFGDPETDYQNTILDLILESIDKILENEYRNYILINAISWKLVYTDSKCVVKISKKLAKFPLIQLARIRNGHVKCWIDFYKKPNFEDLDEGLCDNIFKHAKEKHPKKIQDDLKRILESSQITDEEIYDTLYFAGSIQISGIHSEIINSWINSKDKKKVLPAVIWAVINCCEKDTKSLDPIFEYWSEMINEGEPSYYLKFGEKHFICRWLGLQNHRRFRKSMINYLKSQAQKHDSLKLVIYDILKNIDDPDVIQFNIYNSSEYLGKSLGEWDFKNMVSGRKLSQSSLDGLEAIWKNDTESEIIRKNAFYLWKNVAGRDLLPKLQNIHFGSPFFKKAIVLRIRLKDCSALPDYLKLISENPVYFLFAHILWCVEVKIVVENYLDSIKDSIPKDFTVGSFNSPFSYFYGLLMAIPIEAADKLLLKYWDSFKFDSLFILTALYIGTPISLELAENAIKECPPEIDIFYYLTFVFNANTDGGRRRCPTLDRLNNLIPYLDRLSKSTKSSLVDICAMEGFSEWAKTYLPIEFNKKHYISDSDIRDSLKEVAKEKKGFDYIRGYLLGDFKRKMVSKDRLLRILNQMIENDNSLETFKIAAACINLEGNRGDLEILEKYKMKVPTQEVLDIKNNIRFLVFRRTLE